MPGRIGLLALALSLTAVGAAVGQDAQVFVAGQDGYHTYRIPALVTAPDGSLLAICEGRKTSRADHGDVDVVMRRSQDRGRTWSPLKLIHEQGGAEPITIGNPCPVVDQDTGVIWLPMTRDNDDVLLTSSADSGATWSRPRTITGSVKQADWTWYATGPGTGIQLTREPHRGRLVIPCDHRVREIADRRQSTRSHVIYSDDHGRTWRLGGVTDYRMNECAVAETVDGSLLLNMRSNRGLGRRGVAVSDNGGQTWSPCRDDATLVEPVCQASLVRWTWPGPESRSRLAFCNPASESQRRNLTLRLSYDEGRTWPVTHQVHAGSAAYSSLAVLPDGQLGILYERDDYERIVFTRVSLAELER